MSIEVSICGWPAVSICGSPSISIREMKVEAEVGEEGELEGSGITGVVGGDWGGGYSWKE